MLLQMKHSIPDRLPQFPHSLFATTDLTTTRQTLNFLPARAARPHFVNLPPKIDDVQI
jgi:hypothetical protein